MNNPGVSKLLMHLVTAIGIYAVLCSGCAVIEHKEEIGVLRGMAKDASAQEEAVKKESEIFKKCREALVKGSLAAGSSANDVLKRAGEPVLARRITEEELLWSYKPGDTTWFDGPVIRLYFDRSNRLTRWECSRTTCGDGASEPAAELGGV